jgi:hypothetical protein
VCAGARRNRAERRPDGQFALAAHRARQDQIGDVRARDDEHDGRRGQQHEENRSRRCGDLIAERRDSHFDAGLRVRLGVFANHCRVYRRQFGARGVERGAWCQTAEELGHAVCAARDHRGAEVMRARHHVGDDLGRGRIGYRWLEDADDRGGARTKADDLANHARIAVEGRGPERVAAPRGFRAVVRALMRRPSKARPSLQNDPATPP